MQAELSQLRASKEKLDKRVASLEKETQEKGQQMKALEEKVRWQETRLRQLDDDKTKMMYEMKEVGRREAENSEWEKRLRWFENVLRKREQQVLEHVRQVNECMSSLRENTVVGGNLLTAIDEKLFEPLLPVDLSSSLFRPHASAPAAFTDSPRSSISRHSSRTASLTSSPCTPSKTSLAHSPFNPLCSSSSPRKTRASRLGSSLLSQLLVVDDTCSGDSSNKGSSQMPGTLLPPHPVTTCVEATTDVEPRLKDISTTPETAVTTVAPTPSDKQLEHSNSVDLTSSESESDSNDVENAAQLAEAAMVEADTSVSSADSERSSTSPIDRTKTNPVASPFLSKSKRSKRKVSA